MQKPIEPGCLALVFGMVVDTDLNGVCVEVVRKMSSGEIVLWADGSLSPCSASASATLWVVERRGSAVQECFHAENLRRIDGGDPDAVQEEAQDQEVPTDALA